MQKNFADKNPIYGTKTKQKNTKKIRKKCPKNILFGILDM